MLGHKKTYVGYIIFYVGSLFFFKLEKTHSFHDLRIFKNMFTTIPETYAVLRRHFIFGGFSQKRPPFCKNTSSWPSTATNVIFISVFNQLDTQSLFHNKFDFMPLHVSSTCAHHQEVKIALHSLVHETAT